ncbi:MAG TPA: cystathionine beta-lyase [Sphingomonas sp.]|uniref:cystathionine beta-lyase n=1 Tax=Sphingomonas sp. TaxID=28214 RepID=UPI002D098EF1|nr:cystathionine beta-lyase [Sphingomonas sp.]HMI20265.1 cystathionine beta-lyase [Sphingomonas sp.]
MSGKDKKGSGTRLVEAGRRKEWTQGLVSPAVWRASTVLFDDVAALRDAVRHADDVLYYGRRGGPTQWSLAEALTELEPGAAGTTLHASGAAAVTTALLAVLEPGDELLMTDSTYEPTRAFCDTMLKKLGIATRYYDPGVRGAAIEALFSDKTKVLFMESPGSLTFEVQDVPALCAAAKQRGVVTMMDNTWATPLLFPAIGHGVDVAILACTKYVAGHSDVMLGSCTAIPGLFEKIRKTTQIMGQAVSPDDAFLVSRGLRTMGVRLKQHGAAGLEVAHWLQAQPQVAKVIHPALPGDAGHALWARDFLGAAGLFAFALHGDDAARVRLVDALRHFGIGFSWGGFESLALPIDPERVRTAVPWASPGKMVRLQIGLEEPADLIADLARGLAAADLG